MDTVAEESSRTSSSCEPKELQHLLHENTLALQHPPEHRSLMGSTELSPLHSRRPSAILASLRRPSQILAMSTISTQRRYLLGLFQTPGERSGGQENQDPEKERKQKKYNRQLSEDALSTTLSALYAKLLVVLGMAFPITEIISHLREFFYQGFYLYLYLGSICFVTFMYATLIREKAVESLMQSYDMNKENSNGERRRRSLFENLEKLPAARYGSFYLRLGAISFGIGSMVYSGLEFGRYFELRNNKECYSNVLQAITPATRMLLTLVQVQFIFLNGKDLELSSHKVISRFGLMHMIATNICEWLYVLVEETKHEIVHLSNHTNDTANATHGSFCREGNVMGSLVTNASAFLFPCKIEYSLICAVILFEMWKKLTAFKVAPEKDSTKSEKDRVTFLDKSLASNSGHHFSIDCSNSHRGLFGGILVIVLTIISLIMFFVLTDEDQNPDNEHSYRRMAEFEVNVVELILYIVTTICVVVAMYKMRDLKYDRKVGEHGPRGLGLDTTLLVVAQIGTFIYCIFSIIACYNTLPSTSPASLSADILFLLQTCLQTIFVLDGWWRRCRNLEQARKQPARELITFLIVANMAMWTINSLMKNRAEFRQAHLVFFGHWAWTIITHISMPLAIFYRFHSTICLFEIWKTAYKLKRSSRIDALI